MALEEKDKNDEQKQDVKAKKGLTHAEALQQIEDLRRELESKPSTTSEGGIGELTAVFAELTKKLNSTTGEQSSGSFQGYTDLREVNEADFLEKDDWVTYMVPAVYHVISDSIINGKPVKAPYGPIEFKFMNQKTVKNGREEDIFNTAAFVCKTKAELEFMDKHHLKNISFFTDSSKMAEVDLSVIGRIVPIFNSLKSLSTHELFIRCQKQGIETSSDPYQMRSALALDSAQKMYEREKESLNKRTRANMLEAQLIDQKLR